MFTKSNNPAPWQAYKVSEKRPSSPYRGPKLTFFKVSQQGQTLYSFIKEVQKEKRIIIIQQHYQQPIGILSTSRFHVYKSDSL